MNFQIQALQRSNFVDYFNQSTEALAAQNISREIVQQCPNVPCRISLEDAPVGESVLLLNYQHLPQPTPYQASHAIYIRETVEDVTLAVNSVPQAIRDRLLSLRVFNDQHYMIDAEVVDGAELETQIDNLSKLPGASYLHIHYAKPGCFAARLDWLDRG